MVREELLDETYQGFVDRAGNMKLSANFKDPTFEKSPFSKKTARDLKRIWSEEADHGFMDSVVKIHWISSRRASTHRSAIQAIKKFLSVSGKNEISTSGYLPDSREFRSTWGDYGVIVKGRTTFAANHMDQIFSGYASKLPDNVVQKYQSSGVPKRPTVFNTSGAFSIGKDYILDAASFGPSTAELGNEFIVGNWRPVAIVMPRSDPQDFPESMVARTRQLMEIEKLVRQRKITTDQFTYVVISKDIDETLRHALDGVEGEKLLAVGGEFSATDPRGRPWGWYLYQEIKESFDPAKGFDKLGLPVVGYDLKPI
jgi:hypothetical protein